MGLPLIEQARIQAQVLVPLVRTLQAELGEVRANALVRKSLGALYRQYGEAWWQGQRTSKSEEKVAAAFAAFAAGDALEYEVLKQTPDLFEVNVTECRYAEFYRELGAPELGFLLTCTSDFPFVEGFNGEVQLTRTQTIMQGASHCDFRYTLKQK
jgi:L-2-amino-thiazoline-4-carboxylic acid hydrolase-like protein